MNESQIEELLSSSCNRAIEVTSLESIREEMLQAYIDKIGYILVRLDGSKVATKEELLNELAFKMEFPDYFGKNWDALEECLRDLEWLPAKGYIFFFSSPENFIANFISDFKTFIEIVSSVSVQWADENIRFLLILAAENENQIRELVGF